MVRAQTTLRFFWLAKSRLGALLCEVADGMTSTFKWRPALGLEGLLIGPAVFDGIDYQL